MKIAIIGFGLEGQAAYRYWQAGNDITVCDQNEQLSLPDDVTTRLGEGYLNGLDDFDVVVRSPFVRADAIINANSPAIAEKITSNTNEFMRVCPTRNIIGITGTKGKGTTSTLVSKMLQAAGFTVHIGGNIGTPALELLQAGIGADDWVVLELSSYQLSDLRLSPHIAACLMVEPEHLDWHTDVREYLESKQRLFLQQSPTDITVYYPFNDNSVAITAASRATKIPYMQAPGAVIDGQMVVIDGQAICNVSDLKLLGRHNWQNVCAAITIVWNITQNTTAIASVLSSFGGLPFRIEFRQEINGVRYFNDSFATGPGACMAAMAAIDGPKVMIMGGYDRGLDLNELAQTIAETGDGIRHILIIGDSRNRMADSLRQHGFDQFTISEATTMPEIVQQATSLAQPGDAVVLSPGFASFGLFKNFEDRGRQFNAAVEAL